MKINNVEDYLAEHHAQPLSGGKSGAQVWAVDENYVLKYIKKEELGNENLYAAYRREASWYQYAVNSNLHCLPQVMDIGSTDEEILILMRRYRPLSRSEMSEDLLQKITEAIAAVHTSEIPPFLRQERYAAQPLGTVQIQEAVRGWQSVLDEHPGVFSEDILEQLADQINDIILWHDAEEAVLNHGDFHWDNLLQTEKGDIVICDWQGVSAGQASGDLSFFFSRLRGDGIRLDERKVIEFYVQAMKRLSGRTLNREAIEGHMRAADLITSFVFWHQYLHGSTEERVREIYGKMEDIHIKPLSHNYL